MLDCGGEMSTPITTHQEITSQEDVLLELVKSATAMSYEGWITDQQKQFQVLVEAVWSQQCGRKLQLIVTVPWTDCRWLQQYTYLLVVPFHNPTAPLPHLTCIG